MRANVRTSRARADACSHPCFEHKLVGKLRAAMPSDDELESARTIARALADKNRLKVLHALRLGGELCVCDVAHVLGMSISTASHHLRKLRDLRILRHRSDGKKAFYSIRDPFAADLVRRVLAERAA